MSDMAGNEAAGTTCSLILRVRSRPNADNFQRALQLLILQSELLKDSGIRRKQTQRVLSGGKMRSLKVLEKIVSAG